MVATTFFPSKNTKQHLSIAFKIERWERLEPLYKELSERPINNFQDLETWLLDRNKLAATVEEEFGWRYIQFTTNANDETALKRYEYYIQHIAPNVSNYDFKLNEKLVGCSLIDQLDQDQYYIYLREIKNAVQLYREENVKRYAEERLLAKQYGALMADFSIKIEEETYTLQQTSPLLELPDRTKREEVFRKTSLRLLQDKEQYEQIFDELLQIRHQTALEAGFDNYIDFKFKDLGRFDYTAEDCYNFQESIRKEILPLLAEVHERKKKRVGVSHLRPWDLAAAATNTMPLKPFKDVDELVEKATNALDEIDPYFGNCIRKMYEVGHLDLEARLGKRPGGYNMPLAVTGIPFVFMNTSTSVVDMRTFMHESGHAVHSFLTNHHELITAKQPPSEIAELAAMSMELLSMDKWNHFFQEEKDIKRAQIWLLENILYLLPWIAIIDRFQHWIYANPKHGAAERRSVWLEILNDFNTDVLDRSDLEENIAHSWHRQLHLFEVPFYYIEYGMAQLGAIAIWKNYKENGQQAVDQYKAALQLGYSQSIKDVYTTAGTKFDFSEENVRELAQFLKKEIDALLEE